MKIIGINASPEQYANMHAPVEALLMGPAEDGAGTRPVHLKELKIYGRPGYEG